MTEKNLVLLRQTNNKNNGTKPVFLDIDLHDKLKDLSTETGLPLRQVANKFIRYGIENVEIKDE